MEYTITITQNDVDKYNHDWLMKHPRAKNKPIKGPQHPSLNEYMTANNMKANHIKQNWKDFIYQIISDLGYLDLGIQRCEVTYRTYFKQNRPRDLDNITPKYIFDGLTAAGFWEDDSCNHVTKLIIECGYDKINPRIELVVCEC